MQTGPLSGQKRVAPLVGCLFCDPLTLFDSKPQSYKKVRKWYNSPCRRYPVKLLVSHEAIVNLWVWKVRRQRWRNPTLTEEKWIRQKRGKKGKVLLHVDTLWSLEGEREREG